MGVSCEFDNIVEYVNKEQFKVPYKEMSLCGFRTVFCAIKAILASFGVLKLLS